MENVFVCFVSLFTLLQKYIKDNFYDVYIEDEFCSLFAKKFPWYIHELAAQTLGNLIRKFPNKKEIFLICLKRLKKTEEETEGVGRLLFHTIKSDVARRLHTSTPTTFSLLLDLVINAEAPLEQSTKAFVVCLHHLAAHVTLSVDIPSPWQETWAKDSSFIWPVVFDKLNVICKTNEVTSRQNSLLDSMYQFIFEMIKFKNCALVTDFDELFKNLATTSEILTEDSVGIQLNEIVAKLLNCSQYNALSSSLGNFLTSFLGASLSPSVFFHFIHIVTCSPDFDTEILPAYIEYILDLLSTKDDENIKADVIRSLADVIGAKVVPIRSADDMTSWSSYSLDFVDVLTRKKSYSKEKTPMKLLESVLAEGLASDISNIETLIQCCICLPNISELEKEDFVPYLFWIMNEAFERIQKRNIPLISPARRSTAEPPKKKKKKKLLDVSCQSNLNLNISLASDESSRKLIFLVSIIIETLCHLIPPEDFLSALAGKELIVILKENNQYRENVHLLKAVDIHLSVLADEKSRFITEETLMDLYPILGPSLASPKPLVRLLVSHIFSLFPIQETSASEENNNMFDIMFRTESSSLSPLEYKERLRLLSHLDVDNVNLMRPVSRMYDQAPLLFLIGQLYINFKELWSPVIKSITKYAYSLHEENFWPLWMSKLELTSHFALRSLCDKEIEEENFTSFSDSGLNELHSDLISHPGYEHLITKPNYLNFRDLLWQAMQQFPNICERHNKDVVMLFFEFLNKELFPADYSVAPTQDVSVHLSGDDTLPEDETLKDETIPENSGEPEVIDARNRVRKAPIKSLCEHLALFAKFHNPKVIYKSKELEEIYSEFLSHPYVKAQKLSLDAIMTYNHTFLAPYRETLYNILDDNSFKNEISLFDIEGKGEEESKSLKEDHRTRFMPFLMRILYGKMQYKTGGHTAGKSNSGARKGIVLRFLAGANESELDTFLNLSFDIILSHLEGSALDVVERVERELDPKRVVPLKRMQGALGTLETIFDKIGNLLVNKRYFMLKVVLFIMGTSVNLLENRSEVCSHFLPILKNLRQMAMQKIITFFKNYEDYSWSGDELEAVFRTAVWPSLPRLPDEGIYSPTPLVQLFSCWSANSSLHVLLTRHHAEDESLTPMPFLMKLVSHHKCSSQVTNAVHIIIENLLTKSATKVEDAQEAEEEEEDEVVQPFDLPLENVLSFKEKEKELGIENLTCGESVVLSCLDDLLVHIKNALDKLRKGQMINKRDFTILIHLAQWIRNKKDAHELLDSIIPLLKKSCVKQNDKTAYLLDTCCKLVQIIDAPDKYSTDFLVMFSLISERNARQSLCQVMASIHLKGEKAQKISKWCFDLNSWNEEVMDRIDSERRLKCYREVSKYLNTVEIFDSGIFIFLIHQNLWVVNHYEDKALHDLSILSLQTLLNAIVRLEPKCSSKVKIILDQHIVPLLKYGLKNKEEVVRNAIMSILGFAIHKCHAFNARLKDLHSLSDADDIDSDFFLNMSHLQRGRRTKAMVKLADYMNEEQLELQTESITEFILPIVSVYLFKDEYSTDHNLLTGSITAIGALAKKLPWYHYQNLLKHYLNLISRELSQLKLGVRVLETVIDAFHEEVIEFDDSNWKEILEETNDGGLLSGSEAEEEDGDDSEKSASTKRAHVNSTRVYGSLVKFFIPQIQKTLSQRSLRDTEHKVNQKKYPEDEDIKRIPLALALTKLLKKLPKKLLNININSIFMKLINYLKSKAESIRREARNMLVKVMQELGGKYLTNLVTDMNNILTLGYQTHVMVFTLHAVLVAFENTLTPFDLKFCLSTIMDICLDDLFGDKAEEKGVSQITTKVREVKADKGYSIMGIIAQTIAVNQVETMMVPLRDKLQTHDKKVVNKIICCLQKIGNGLERNTNIEIKHKSIFIYGILTEKIKELKVTNATPPVVPKEKDARLNPSDSFLLPPEPTKYGLVPKVALKTTSHALVEFALNLLCSLIKRGHLESTNEVHVSLLDAYVKIMSDCLPSDYPEVSIQALHVIGCLIKFPLPSLKTFISTICGQMFVILSKFASAGLSKGKIFELVQLDFKILALTLKEVSFNKLEAEQAKVLLYYARSNLDDYNQHHSSFIILHALINRKVNFVEFHALMETIKEMSIISTNLNMSDQARRIFLNYVLNYTMKKTKLVHILDFFIENVSYHIPEGRMSSAITLNELISKYPRNIFDHKVEVTLWFRITDQLVKEESNKHKAMLKKILKSLFSKSSRRNLLIDNCLKLMEDDLMQSKAQNALSVNISTQSLLAMLEVPIEEHPSSVFDEVLPKVSSLLHPGRYQLSNETDEDFTADHEAHCLDLALNSVLDLFTLFMDVHFNNKNVDKWMKCVGEEVWKYIQDHLLYPNLKVRLTAGVILGKLFAMHPPEGGSSPSITSTPEMAQSVLLDLCEQLNTECPVESPMLSQLGISIVRNLIYLIRQGRKIPIKLNNSNRLTLSSKKEDEDEKNVTENNTMNESNTTQFLSFLQNDKDESESNCYLEGAYWVLHRVGVMAYDELRKKGNHTTFRRECLLNLLAGVVMILDKEFESASSIVSFAIHHLTREMSDKSLPEILVTKTKEVADLIRDRIGGERYSEEIIRVQATLEKKRTERKTRDRVRIITNPELAMHKKAKKNVAKKQAKKRKLTELKLQTTKSKRLRDMVIVRS